MVVGFTRAIVADGAPYRETLVHKSGLQRGGNQWPELSFNVMLRKEIHDPQGEAIASAAHRLGFGQVLGVRQGKRFEVELGGPADESALARVAELAGELLANPVIEEFTVREG